MAKRTTWIVLSLFLIGILSLSTEPVGALKSQNKETTVAFVGDSITAAGQWQKWYPELKVTNLAVKGYKSSHLKNKIKDISQLQPDKMFILIGINDFYDSTPRVTGKNDIELSRNRYYRSIRQKITNVIHRYITLPIAVSNLRHFFSEVRAASPNTHIYVHDMFRVNAEKWDIGFEINQEIFELYNAEISKMCTDYGLDCIGSPDHLFLNGTLKADMTDDGLHLNSKGYQEWKLFLDKYCK